MGAGCMRAPGSCAAGRPVSLAKRINRAHALLHGASQEEGKSRRASMSQAAFQANDAAGQEGLGVGGASGLKLEQSKLVAGKARRRALGAHCM